MQNQPTSFLTGGKDTSLNPESQLEKKLINRGEQFTNESNIGEIKEQAISSDLTLGNDERAKIFKNRRLRQKIKIESKDTLQSKLTIPLELYKKCSDMNVQPEQLQQFVSLVKNNADVQSQYEGLVGLRKLLSLPVKPPIQEIIDYGFVSYFIDLLDKPLPEFQYEALWCLTNIAGGTSDQANAIVIKGGINKIIKLMDSTIEEVQDQAVWTLGNIGGDSTQLRDLVIEQKGYDKLITLFSTTERPVLKKHCTWTIANFCRFKPALPYDLLKKALPFIIKSIITLPEDVDLLSDACFTLSYMTETYKKSIKEIMDTGLISSLFKYLEYIFFN